LPGNRVICLFKCTLHLGFSRAPRSPRSQCTKSVPFLTATQPVHQTRARSQHSNLATLPLC